MRTTTRERWSKTTDAVGWERHLRAGAVITVPPSGGTTRVPVMLFLPSCTTEHPSLAAAKRAFRRGSR